MLSEVHDTYTEDIYTTVACLVYVILDNELSYKNLLLTLEVNSYDS